MDKSREEFEDYFEDSYGWGTGDYPDQTYVTEVWNMWQASRKALVLEMPTQESYDDPLSAYQAIADCAERIRAAGITVKGDE